MSGNHVPSTLPRLSRLAATATLLFTLTVVHTAKAARMEKSITIRIGYFSQVHDAALLDIGHYLPHTFHLQYIKFLRYLEAEIALDKGELDFSSMGYANAVLDAGQGRMPAMKLIEGMARGAVDLVCHKGVVVKRWADLKGKTVGELPGGTAQVFLDDALVTHGLSPHDLHFVDFTAPGPPLLEALKSGTVQCFAAYEPFTAEAVAQGFAYYPPTPLSQDSFHGINNALAVNSTFAAHNHAIVQKVAAALLKATLALRANRSLWIAVAAAKLGFPKAMVANAAHHSVLDWHLYQNYTYSLAKAMARLDLASQPKKQLLNSYFDTSYLHALGR